MRAPPATSLPIRSNFPTEQHNGMITGTYVHAIITLEAALLPLLTTPVTNEHHQLQIIQTHPEPVLPLQHGLPTERKTELQCTGNLARAPPHLWLLST